MKNTKIINLGRVKDLLSEWEKVRVHIIAGGIAGWHTAIRGEDGREAIYLGGVFKEDPRAALSAMLRSSAARTLVEDEPPLFQASTL